LLKVLKRIDAGNGAKSDIDLLHDVAQNIEGRTICALGEAAAWPVRFTVERFREEFEARTKDFAPQSPNRVHALRKGGLELVQVHVPVVERV
jgi:NADH-quinone oxidoreductase subunit F